VPPIPLAFNENHILADKDRKEPRCRQTRRAEAESGRVARDGNLGVRAQGQDQVAARSGYSQDGKMVTQRKTGSRDQGNARERVG